MARHTAAYHAVLDLRFKHNHSCRYRLYPMRLSTHSEVAVPLCLPLHHAHIYINNVKLEVLKCRLRVFLQKQSNHLLTRR